MAARIVQLSDLHLVADRHGTCRGVPSADCLAELLAHFAPLLGDAERIVITGDLAQDELATTYELLRELLDRLVGKCLFLPGNHDNRPALRQAFADKFAAVSEAALFDDQIAGWRLLGLDSHVPGESYGRLAEEVLDWLANRLDEAREQPTLLWVHHPPIDVGSRWLDSINLREAEPLARLICRSPQVAGLIAGHIHQPRTTVWAGVPLWTAPSTAFQFAAGQPAPTMDHAPPGLRVFELDGDQIRTSVERLPRLAHRAEDFDLG